MLFRSGDVITFDTEQRRIDIAGGEEMLARRRDSWQRPKSSVTRGALAKYRAEVSSASEGAVTRVPAWDE